MKLIKMLRQKVYEAFSETLESQRLLRLGKISHGKKLVARTRKYVIQHQDWSRLGVGFLYQGRTQLPFCAMLGPIFTIESKTRRYARLRTILLQYKPDSSVEAFALPVGKGSKLLADELLLSKDEAEALEAMLKAGKEVLGESDELRLTYVPLEQEIIPHQARVSCTTCSQEQAFQVLTHIGQIGREIFLAGLLNQLSVFCPDQFRPCLMVRLIGTSQTLETVRLLLRAVNFSSWITGEGTAPPILRTSECSTPPRYPGLALYRLDGKRDLLLSTLERHHQIQSRSEATPSPFPAVPLLLTENCALRGYVWNIELGLLPELSPEEQDNLRAVSSCILMEAKPIAARICQDIAYAQRAPDAYRTTVVSRWRQALVSAMIRTVFPSEPFSGQSRHLFLSDAEQAALQIRLRQGQLQRALLLLDKPAAYGEDGIILCPTNRDEAFEQLQRAFAFLYQPSAQKTGRVGPFLCFSETSLQRFLQKHQLPHHLLQEIIHSLKIAGRIQEKQETIHFKEGKAQRFIKLDIGMVSDFLTTERCEQQLLKG